MQSSLPKINKIVKSENGQPTIVEIPLELPSTNQVLVKVESAPVNPTDLLRVTGYYDSLQGYSDPIGQGTEGAGIIVAVGDNLKVPYKVGDRVHLIGPGIYKQYYLTTSESVTPILQPDLSYEDAASHFVNPATVYYMGIVAETGGHKAVIHTAATSALGRMLIRYFKLKGIKLINVVRREEAVEELLKEGADYVLNSTAPDFEAKLKEIAEKENATLAFEAIGGDFTSKILTCQPPGSTCAVYGVLSGNEVKSISITELFKRKVLKSLLIFDYMNELTPEQTVQFLNEVHSFLPTAFKSQVQKTFKIDDIKEAFEFSKQNSSKGKVLLQFH